MIKTPQEALKPYLTKVQGEYVVTESCALKAIEAYHNQFESINKQLAVNFAQSLLKDHSTQEVTLETFNDFLNIK